MVRGALIEQLGAGYKVPNAGRGDQHDHEQGERVGDDAPLAVTVFVSATGRRWRQLPSVFGPSGPTAHRRFTEWSRARVWGKLHRLVLDERGARGALDWSRCAIDSVNMRALKGGGLMGPNPVDRGKKGSKIHLITERTGPPISIGISAANTHDSQGLEPFVRGIPPIRSRRGPRRRQPAKLHADKGYDYDHLRRRLRSRNISPRIAHKGVEPSQRLGRHRWTVDRTAAWGAAARTAATSPRPHTSWPSAPSPPL
jgi:transposase